MALILIRGAMRQEAPSMQFPSVSCKGEIVLISGYLRVCMWACTFVYYILRAHLSQGRTSYRRPVSQTGGWIKFKNAFGAISRSSQPANTHTDTLQWMHTTHQYLLNPSISTALFACSVKYVNYRILGISFILYRSKHA